jgi:hypothetical protein
MDAAYDAILFSALALFALRRFRVAGGSGHHRLALEGMAHLLALKQAHTGPHITQSDKNLSAYVQFALQL